MSDRMRVIPFDKLVNWIIEEYRQEDTIFGISAKDFYPETTDNMSYCGEQLNRPLGPAAGPHTQLAQNLAASYLTGGRFFELKTVQILDRLTFPKPCINAADECYNTEWSTELSIEEAYAEYVKGWFLLHLLGREFFNLKQRNFIFNMSVGYDLAGIKSEKVNCFIEGMKDASTAEIFTGCRTVIKQATERFNNIDENYIDKISPFICNSIALSTMHGCPHDEIEAICKYLILEKKLHTHVKLNPTLLGYDYVRNTLDQMGYDYIKLSEKTFTDDLSYEEGIPMLQRLIALAGKCGIEFGVKLSNTLPVLINRDELPGDQMYLSGKPLYALTINLAYKLAAEFDGKLNISYSGGADRNNTAKIYATGIKPITVVTTLLKPGGYARLTKLAGIIEPGLKREFSRINLAALKNLSHESLVETTYQKKKKTGGSLKAYRQLPLFDCRESCSICVSVCPNRANIQVETAGHSYKYSRQIMHLDGMCNECGNCATFCPFGGIPYREKPTLFWFEEDFTDSKNGGFQLITATPTPIFRIRSNNEIFEIGLSALNSDTVQAARLPLLTMIKIVYEHYRHTFLS
ncbi:MAG: selenate reductase [Firmicutes bacterium]|nr:selenate reductase [Bacillota bacterium]